MVLVLMAVPVPWQKSIVYYFSIMSLITFNIDTRIICNFENLLLCIVYGIAIFCVTFTTVQKLNINSKKTENANIPACSQLEK